MVAPETAAEIARDMKIKIYTIGVGAAHPMSETVPYLDERGKVIDYGMVAPLDENALRNIASMAPHLMAKSICRSHTRHPPLTETKGSADDTPSDGSL